MFDPTVYDNLKVVIEGAVYDLDLDGHILVTGRKDRIDLSTMSREYVVRFELRDQQGVTAEIRLLASMADLAAEILELEQGFPGCELELSLQMNIKNIETDCKKVEALLESIWGNEVLIEQEISFPYTYKQPRYVNTATIRFNRKIAENQIEDISSLMEHVIRSLRELILLRA